MTLATDGFLKAGLVGNIGLNLPPDPPEEGRSRHKYGNGPFAKLRMPLLPNEPGVYLWQEDDKIVYIGQTTRPLKVRLGTGEYSTISRYNTYARQLGRRNGGQETNCRINALANISLISGRTLVIWYKVTSPEIAKPEEATWIRIHGLPSWNRRDER